MNKFKFFNENIKPTTTEMLDISEPNRPLLENETIIHYWNDGDFYVILYARVIAWNRDIHSSRAWRECIYEGTMERFFYNRLEIPVIRCIVVLGTDGALDRLFFESDVEYLSTHNFGNYSVKIYYYEHI